MDIKEKIAKALYELYCKRNFTGYIFTMWHKLKSYDKDEYYQQYLAIQPIIEAEANKAYGEGYDNADREE